MADPHHKGPQIPATFKPIGVPDQVVRAAKQLNRKFLFETVRLSLFDGKMSAKQVSGVTAILDAWQANYAHNDDRWLAYALATTHHETDRTMQPIEEYGKGKGKKYGQRVKLSGKTYTDTKAIFYGRGYVQITWYENYEKAGIKLGLGRKLIDSPELAMNPAIAAYILFAGMIEGWFTGKKLGDYFNAAKQDWVNARRIINGTDKAQLIASYAQKYYRAISYTG